MARETVKKLQASLRSAESELQQLIAESSVAGDYGGVRNAAKVAEFWAARPAHRPGLDSEQAKWEAFRPRRSDTNHYILDVLKQAERAFRRLKRQAVDQDDRDSGALARQHAQLVRAIAGRFVQVRQSGNSGSPSPRRSESRPRQQEAMLGPPPLSYAPLTDSSSESSAMGGYPKFQVQQKHVVRIGWSKTENCEYVHRVSLSAYRNTLNALENLTQSANGPLTSSRIHREVQRICREGIRSHEIYTVLGMLKEQGIIESTGADLFLVPSNVGAVAQTALSA